MQKTLQFLGLGLLCVALSTTMPTQVVAQDRGTDQAVAENLGYGLESGDAVIIIIPEDLDPGDRVVRTGIEVTGGVTSPVSVGNCHRGELPMQAGIFGMRDGSGSPVEMELAVLYPDNVELPEGIMLGAWREGGPCGPGYQILRGHILDTDY